MRITDKMKKEIIDGQFKEVSSLAIKLYLYLLAKSPENEKENCKDYGGYVEGHGWYRWTRKEMREETGIAEDCIKRKLDELITFGLVETVNSKYHEFPYRTVWYRVMK